MGKLSKIVLFFFSPLLIPTWLFTLLYFYYPTKMFPYGSLSFLLIALIITCLLPYFSLNVAKQLGPELDPEKSPWKSRILPLAYIWVFYMINTYAFILLFKESATLTILIGGFTATIFLVLLISFFWNISAYSACAMSIVGFLTAFHIKEPTFELIPPILISIVIVGLVMSFRLWSNKHSLAEVLMGALVGFVTSFSVLIFLG